MANNQPLSSIVNVQTMIEAGGLLRREFGIGLFLTDDATLGTGDNRILVAASFDDVVQVFSDTSEPYKAANAWFSQSPLPKNLIIGRWYTSATAAVLIGGKLELTPAEFAALGTVSLSITVDGTPYTAATIDLSGVTTYTNLASTIQTDLVTESAPVTVTYDSLRTALVITTTTTGATATITAATGTLASDAKLDTASLESITNGSDVETVVEALENIKAINDSFSLVTIDETTLDSDKETLADYVEAEKLYLFACQSSDPNILLSSDTTSIAYNMFNKELEYTFLTYSSTADYKAVSAAARISSINFDSTNSIITLMFKVLPTLLPDSFTQQQIDVMKSKNVNFYTNYATQPIYNDGRCCKNETWVDVVYSLLWFNNAVQVDVFDLLVSDPRVPQTSAGNSLIYHSIVNVCQQATSNGMISTGIVSDAMKNDIISTTGDSKFNGTLYNGYRVWTQPVSAQSESDRIARKATAKKVWLKGSGAIHSVDIVVIFEN